MTTLVSLHSSTPGNFHASAEYKNQSYMYTACKGFIATYQVQVAELK